MFLDLSSIRKAIALLNRALDVSTEDRLSKMPVDQQEVIKAGVIQNFEFTYELCWKFIKRWLEMNINPGVADGVTRRELFRLAAENLLIVDVEQWMRYHETRNLTSH
jgi:nucleotidyltransferase substrate binding protein (TIGR01987 family)